jgi:putative transposase
VPGKRGPVGAATDADLVGHIRRVLAKSPFHGEGYRKVWARLRHRGIRTASGRARRLIREHHLQAPRRGGDAHGPVAHDGTVPTEEPDTMWGTDMTTTVTTGEVTAHVFVGVDHCTCECVGLHAAKRGNRFEAHEPLRQGGREDFGGFEAKLACGLAIAELRNCCNCCRGLLTLASSRIAMLQFRPSESQLSRRGPPNDAATSLRASLAGRPESAP